MTDELFFYALTKNILQQSKVIEGRFIVAEGYGNDLNANSLDDVFKDILGGLKTPKKYPISVMLPPVEIIQDYEKGWADFKVRQFFLTTTYFNGDNSTKSLDPNTNTSSHSIQYDWKDMRECAGSFRVMFNDVVRFRGLTGIIREKQTQDVISRYSMMGNDRLSGVEVAYEISLFVGCRNPDYEVNAWANIVMPDLIIHPLHKH